MAAKARGLCQRCYQTPEIRVRYPLPDRDEDDTPAPSRDRPAVSGAPRSAEKVAELRRLAELRQRLFSQNDEPVNSCLQTHGLTGLSLSQRLARLRQRKRWTYRELGRRARLSHQAVYLLETGRRQPRVDTLHRLAVALGEPVTTLLGA